MDQPDNQEEPAMTSRIRLALALLVLSLSAGLARADRPSAGQGGIFADGITGVSFHWTDLENDFLQVFWDPGDENDFARQNPSGKIYVHVDEQSLAVFAIVVGVPYSGTGSYQAAYFADCNVFDPAAGAFDCHIGPATATMNTHATVIDGITGEECTLTAHMSLFFLPEKACEASFGPGSCPGGSLVIASPEQFFIEVDCGD
jgi:hypothetical protein